MRLGQTQAITLVLISGIIIALVGFAYTWGKPMIEKRSVIMQFTSALKFMEDLDRKIVDMAGSCSFEGGCEEEFELPVPGMMILNESGNTLFYEFRVEQPLITAGEVLFNTADNGSIARYGETPGVLSMTGNRSGSSYTLKFSLRYRELVSDDPFRGYKIQLLRSGGSSGNRKIVISYGGSETRSGEAYEGRDLVLSKIRVQLM